MPTVRLDDTELEYLERGSGDPVVLVHGSLGDLRSWAYQLAPFAERYRVVSYSRRHHHPNRCGDGGPPYSAARHADDLAALLDGLGLGSAHVVGSSYGAYTALFLAARHPERARSVVLSEPPAFPLLDHHPEGATVRDRFLAEVWAPAGELLQRGEAEEGVRTFVDGLFGDGAFDQLEREVRDLIMDNACEFRLETSSPDFWTPFTGDDARRIGTPTLLLGGSDSPPMFSFVLDELERCLPDRERATIDGSSHDVPSEDPEAFNDLVLRFLAEHAG